MNRHLIALVAAFFAMPGSSYSAMPSQYHLKTNSPNLIVCRDPTFAAEFFEISRHRLALADDAYQTAAHRGGCLPILSSVPFDVIGRRTLKIPAGTFHLLHGRLKIDGADDDLFWINVEDAEPVP